MDNNELKMGIKKFGFDGILCRFLKDILKELKEMNRLKELELELEFKRYKVGQENAAH